MLVAAEGTGSYSAVLGNLFEAAGYRLVEAPNPRRERVAAQTDELDAVMAARSALDFETTKLRDRRAGQVDTTVQVLTGAGDRLNVTALIRCHDLGIDARRALTTEQINTIAGWRRHEEDLRAAMARTESVRLTKRVLNTCTPGMGDPYQPDESSSGWSK